MDIKISIPQNPNKIIEILHANGHEAYLVGGCVRDSLVGKIPGDWDITTSAQPTQVKKLFDRTIDTGLQHGTVTILIDRKPYEVTTYRIDGEYKDKRRPESIKYTNNLKADLERRDFTINAMAYNEEDGLIDPFAGRCDLDNGLIKCVGTPNNRFNEDALRMMRAVRFSAQLNFPIELATKNAIIKNASLIKEISMERIQTELNKILLSNNPSKILFMNKLGLLKYILPEFIPCIENKQNNPYHSYDIGEHTIKSIENIEPRLTLRLTMLLHDIGKPVKKTVDSEGIDHFYGHEIVSVTIAKKILKRLKYDNKTIGLVTRLVEVHDYRFNDSPINVRKAIKKIGDDIFLDYLKVREADIKAQHPIYKDEGIKKLREIKKKYHEIKKLNQCISLRELEINGKDLMQEGIIEGKTIGLILNSLLDMVIEDPSKNNREYLLKRAMTRPPLK